MIDIANSELILNMSIGEKLINSLMVTALGMGITFLVLIILFFVIKIMTFILAPKTEKISKVEKDIIEEKESAILDDNSDDEIVAVLTAAIMAYTGGRKKLIVRSFREIEPSLSQWTKLGIEETMNRNI